MTRSELQKDLEAAGTKVCINTIRKVLIGEGFRSRTPMKTPLLRVIHVKNHPQFDKDHLKKPAKFRNSVLWSDEKKIELFGRNSLVTFGGGWALHMIPRIPSQQMDVSVGQ